MDDDLAIKEEAELETEILRSVLKPYSTKILEIEVAYGLILELLSIFERTYPLFDTQIDNLYISLSELVESDVNEIEEEIRSCYDSDFLNDYPSFYTDTKVFSNFYLPFTNLQSVEINSEWGSTKIRLNKSRAQINELLRKIGPGTLSNPDLLLFREVKNYIKNMNLLKWGELKLDLMKGTLGYGDHPRQDISFENQGIKLLIMLLKSNGIVLEYKTVARELNLKSYHSYIENEDAAEVIRFLKRDLHTLLKGVGMPDNIFETFMLVKKGLGYKLGQVPHKNIT